MKQKRPWRRDQPEAAPQPGLPTSYEGDESLTAHMKYPQPGKCLPGICGEEAACKKLPNTTYMCICPHDSSPPTINLECPNRLTVPLTPRPIHNIIPPTGGNSTTPKPNVTSTTPMIETAGVNTLNSDVIVVTLGSSGIVLLIFLIISLLWWKKRGFSCKKDASIKTEPPLTGEPLLAERYITNPQYSSGYVGANNSEDKISVPVIPEETLRFIEEIGEGCFGKVFKGELKIDEAILTVAIKVLKDNASRNAEDDFNREVSIMSSFHHDNILKLMGVVPTVTRGHTPWMVFEYMPYGDLAGVLRCNAPSIRKSIPGLQTLDNQGLLSIALQVAHGMKYLAGQRFVHRDLACRNCLVGHDLTVKIADFGMSRDVYTCDYYKMGGSRPMPIRWMSPESIVYARFTLESDVWSYGVVLWEIYSLGKQPFFGHNNKGASKLILQGIMLVPPENCPPCICELMKACWSSDPKDRIKFPEICEKLQNIHDTVRENWSGGPIRDDRENWTRTLGSVSSGRGLPRPPATLPTILRPSTPPLLQQEQLTDTEGYLVPATPTHISEYITAIPD